MSFVVSVVLLCAQESIVETRAAEMLTRAYFPIAAKAEAIRFDDFEDPYPLWEYKFREPKDGSFFRRSGLLVAQIDDNRANNIAWPSLSPASSFLRPSGDFKLEVDARFTKNARWMNGLGLVFGGNGTWTEYYAFMLGFNFSQHFWSVARVEPRPGTDDVDYHWLLKWGGSPPDVRWYYDWNHLQVVRVGDQIDVYVNDFHLPGGTVTDGTYGPNRLVGLLATSYEWSVGEVEFDNFELTPLNGD